MIKNYLFKLIKVCFYALPLKTQQSLQTQLKNQDNNILNYKIEFLNGDACKIQNYETLTNKMQFSNTQMILKAIRVKLFPMENICILSLIIVIFSGQEYRIDRLAQLILFYTFSCILFQMGISFIQILITWYKRLEYENLINNQICVVFTEISQLSKNLDVDVVDSYKKIKWENLKIGQIVCLQNGDHSPGDLLILDSSIEQIIVNFSQRQPCLSTFVSPTNPQKGVIIDYKINLSGWVQFTHNEEEIQGTLKLKNDPKVSQFSNKNIIMRGEMLNSANWLFGIVIRVGMDCQKIGFTNKDNFYNNKHNMNQKTKFQIFFVFLTIFAILFIIKAIFDASTFLDQEFFNILTYCLLLIPQNLFWISELWHFIIMILNNRKFQKQNTQQSQIKRDQKKENQNLKILSQNTSKVLIPIPKSNYTQLNLNNSNQTQIIENNNQMKGIQTLSSVDMLDLLQPDLLVFDNPQNLINKQARVLHLLQDNNKYNLNYEKVTDIVQKTQSEAKINFEKLLIDTNRFHTYDEKKPTDLDKLIEEKQVPSLRPSIIEVQEEEVQYTFQKPGFFREKSQNAKERKNTGDSKNPYASFRKASARNLFLSNGALASSNNNSPSAQMTKQRSQYFGKSNPSHSKVQNSVIQKSQIDCNSSDQLVGDMLSEQDFLERLLMKDDIKTNEMLIAIILCNNISTYYHSDYSELKVQYSNKYDPCLIEFASIFDYHFICATAAENNQPDYVVNSIIKKVISIQGTVKVFEILCMLEPTEGRKNTLSLLIRDPESFLLEEGSILYSRIEANSIDFQNKGFTQQLEQMTWDGEKIFIYYKKQLDRQQTQDFLRKYVSIMESYGSRQEEFEKHFFEIEKQSDLLFAVGLKQIYNNVNFCQNDINKQSNIFMALQHNDCRICIMNESNYDDLLIFLRTHQIVHLKEEILQLNEKEPLLLKYKIQQNIAYLINEKLIFNIQEQKHLQKFIIIGNEAFNTILNDDYLKYHLAFISQYASGFGTYQFTSTNKKKLMKLFRLINTSIIGIGNALNNNNVFHKCNASFCVAKFNAKNQQISSLKDDPQITISKPNFIIQKLKDLLVILLIQSPLYNISNQIIMEIQIYRCFMVGLLIYETSFIFNNMDLFYLVLFFIIPSNILTSFIRYYFLFNSQTVDQNALAVHTKSLSKYKRIGNIQLIFKILFKGLIDSIILYVIYQINISFQEQGLVLLYSNLEIIEKSQYIFQILFENEKGFNKLKIILAYCLSIIILNFIFQFIIVQDQYIYFLYSIQGFLLFIFETIFSLSLQYILFVILSYFSVQFNSEYGYAEKQAKYSEIQKFIQQDNNPLNSKKIYSKTTLNKVFGKKDIIDDQILKALKEDNDMFDTNEQLKSNLQFSNKRTEKDFISFIKYEQDFSPNQFIVLLFYDSIQVIIITYQTFVDISQYYTPMIITLISFSCQFILLIVFYKLVRSNFTNKRIQVHLQILSYLLRFTYKILVNINKEQNVVSLLSTVLYAFAFSSTFISQIGFPAYVIMIIVSLIVDVIFIGVSTYEEQDHNAFIILKAAIIFIGILYPIFYLVYRTEYLWRYSYILKNRLQAEYKKLNDVLGLLMPRFIKERMTKGQIQISEDQGEVTILFCDIYDFDKIIKSEQEMIVEFLDNLYRSFDQLCQSNELQKIETVGKTYMAAAGLKDYDVELNQQRHLHSTQRVLDTAIKMLEVAKTMKYGNNEELILKIGIHHGRVIAGVIGAHKPQFSLIGDTVNTTSRVCSTGESGYITLSESAYNNIKDQKYTFKLREVQAKGKGLINTFQLILNQREITTLSESKHNDHKRVKKTSLRIQKSSRQENNDKNFENVKKVTINQSNKSPKVVIRQRQRDLQIQTPKMIIRQKVNEPQIFQSHEKQLDPYFRMESINQLENRSKARTVVNRDEINVDQPQKGDFKEVENKPQFAHPKSLHQSIQISSSVLKKISQQKINHSNSNRHIQMLEAQQIGAEIIDLEEVQQIQQIQQNTQQISRNLSIKKRGTISLEKKLKKQSTKQIQEEKLSAKQLNNEGSLSAVFRSPQEQNIEKIDEIEIPKYSSIIQDQKQLQINFIQQLLKYKVDQQFVLAEDLQIYKSIDQQKYNELYDLFKDVENKQINRAIAFISLFILFKGLIYLILYDHFQKYVVELIIIIACQIFMAAFLNCVIFKLNNQMDSKILKILLVVQMVITSLFDIIILEFTQVLIFDVILQTMTITCTYINIFNLQIFSQYDRKKIALIYLILSLLNISYQDYWYYILFYTLGIIGMSYYSQYSEKLILVRNYQCNQQLESQQEKQKAILQYLLPAHILDRFISDQDNTESFTDVFENATVLFADIAGFTKYSSSVEPEQVVNMLRTLFQNFDEYCQKLNVYKLFTIGDCYVCMGIIDANNRDQVEEAVNVTLFGLKMIDIISSINRDPQFQHLNMRIGAHTGKLIGGVVGTDVVRYDIYGDDVTIANKMESNGQEGQMMVSETTKDLIESVYEDMFEFTFAKEVYIASKDMTISAYYVELSQSIYE